MTTITGRPPQFPGIADHIRARIQTGEYQAYEKLPSARSLAKEFGVSQTTIMRALHSLREEGVTCSNATGTFVTALAAPVEPEEKSARTILMSFGIPEDAATDILLMHAHELAERQRAFMRAGVLSIAAVIDLIDPDRK